MSETLKYITTHDGWVAGLFRKSGEVIELTSVQAKYETNITLQDAKATTKKKVSE